MGSKSLASKPPGPKRMYQVLPRLVNEREEHGNTERDLAKSGLAPLNPHSTPQDSQGAFEAMALSAAQSQKVLSDLIKHIQEQGGQISSEKLSAFYLKHPAHRNLVKNMRSFCQQHPDRIQICAQAGPHYGLRIVQLKEKEVVDQLCAYIQKRGGSVSLADLEGFNAQHPACRRVIHAEGRVPSQACIGISYTLPGERRRV